MKRNNFIFFTLFSVFLLCALVQLSAELTLQQAAKALGEKERALQNANTHLIPAHTEMYSKYNEWVENEEEVNRDNLLAAATTDPLAWAAATIAQVADISDKLRLSAELAGKISTFNTKQQAVTDAAGELQTAWDTYIELAKHLSQGERYEIKTTPLILSPPAASLTCPVCNVTYSGENLGGIGDHVTLCSVNGHKVSPWPYFSCESSGCPLSNEHHTFVCEGGCGELFRSPTYLSPPPSSQGAGNMVKIYYDHRRDPCGKKTGTLTTCSSRAFTCQSPECPNDTNHLVKGECGDHEVRKGDASEVSAHSKLPTSHSQQGRCAVTHAFDGETYQCVLINTYYCDLHDFHDFVDGVGTYPIIEPEEPTNPPSSPSYHSCGNHETSVSGDHSLQASCSASNANGSCTVSGFYACDGHSHVYPSPPDPPSPTLCPANSWTGCGSTTSEATTCGSGHTYYTCNPSAVSWHTADRTCSRTGCNATYTDCSRGSETKHCLGKYKWHK